MDGEPEMEFAGETFVPGDLVDYQAGAIVSRTLIERDGGTVTVFALEEGQSISEHTAPHDALALIIDGTGTLVIDGEEFEIKAGESLVLPAERPHSVRADDRFKMLLAMIR